MRETYQSVVYSEGYMTSPPLVVLGRVFLCLQTTLPPHCPFNERNKLTMNNNAYAVIELFPSQEPLVLLDGLTREQGERLEAHLSQQHQSRFFVLAVENEEDN